MEFGEWRVAQGAWILVFPTIFIDLSSFPRYSKAKSHSEGLPERAAPHSLTTVPDLVSPTEIIPHIPGFIFTLFSIEEQGDLYNLLESGEGTERIEADCLQETGVVASSLVSQIN